MSIEPLSTSGRPISPADAAVAWLIRLSDGASPALEEACAAWRAADPSHERAWQEALRLWQSPELAAALARASLPPRRSAGLVARRALAAAAIAVLMIAGIAWVRDTQGGAIRWAVADLRAPLHGLRMLGLPDGSRITLDAGASADMDFSADGRRMRLNGGRMVVDAAHDRARPLVITTDLGAVRVVGTRFLVDLDDGGLTVAVQEGRVSVETAAGTTLLGPGQRLRLSGTTSPAVVEPVAPEVVGDVAEGWRNFKNTPLVEVLAEIGRYRWMPILLADRGMGLMPVSARLQVSSPDRALAALAETMPVSFGTWPGGFVLASPRQPQK